MQNAWASCKAAARALAGGQSPKATALVGFAAIAGLLGLAANVEGLTGNAVGLVVLALALMASVAVAMWGVARALPPAPEGITWPLIGFLGVVVAFCSASGLLLVQELGEHRTNTSDKAHAATACRVDDHSLALTLHLHLGEQGSAPGAEPAPGTTTAGTPAPATPAALDQAPTTPVATTSTTSSSPSSQPAAPALSETPLLASGSGASDGTTEAERTPAGAATTDEQATPINGLRTMRTPGTSANASGTVDRVPELLEQARQIPAPAESGASSADQSEQALGPAGTTATGVAASPSGTAPGSTSTVGASAPTSSSATPATTR